MDVIERVVRGRDPRNHSLLQVKLGVERGGRHSDARVGHDRHRLRVAAAVDRQFRSVDAGHNHRSDQRRPRRLSRKRVPVQGVLAIVEQVAAVAVIQRRRIRIAQVPRDPMHSGGCRQDHRRREPVVGHVGHHGIRRRHDARVLVDEAARRIGDRQRHGAGRRCVQVVVENRALGRVVADFHFRWQRRVLRVVPARARRRLGPE